jgi:hypothetical protein
MPDFPDFIKNPRNRIARSSQYTDDIEGYVFDGADGSQLALWTCRADRVSQEHAYDFDEYVLVIEGRCTLIVGGAAYRAGRRPGVLDREGTRQAMEVVAGTRTMHVYGGQRARREQRL